MVVSALLELAERCETIGLNMTKRALVSPIQWEPNDLRDAAAAFTVAAALRARAAMET